MGAALCLNAEPPRKLKIVTSIPPLYCLAANIAGDSAQVENLLPTGLSPHDYAFSPSDLRRLRQADLIVVNGLGLESWLGKALESASGGTSAQVVEAAEGLSAELISDSASDEGKRSNPGAEKFSPSQWNPHIWLDPQLSLHSLTNILRAMQKADSAQAALFASNAAAYAARLAKLDSELHTTLAPLGGIPVLTQHRAFPYFARRYGLQVAGVLETTPEVEPSPGHLRELARLAREKKVSMIFVEKMSPSKLARQFASDLGLVPVEFDTLETGPLTLSAYEDGMRKNLEALSRTRLK